MGKRTRKERERDYGKHLAGRFERGKRILVSLEFRQVWEDLKHLWKAQQEATSREKEMEREIFSHSQNVKEIQHGTPTYQQEAGYASTLPEGPLKVVKPIRLKDPFWGPRLKELDRRVAERRAATDAYDQALGAARRRFRMPDIVGPREGATLKGLERWGSRQFLAAIGQPGPYYDPLLLATPGLPEEGKPVQIISPRPSKEDDDFAAATLFNGKWLLLAVNMEHPAKVIEAAFDGVQRFVRGNLPGLKVSRLRLDVEQFRSDATALRSQGLKRWEIARKLLPGKMKSKDPRVRKRALQRVTDALRSRQK